MRAVSPMFLTAQGLHQQPGTGNVQVLPNHYNYCESTEHLAMYTHTFLSSVRVNQYGIKVNARSLFKADRDLVLKEPMSASYTNSL